MQFKLLFLFLVDYEHDWGYYKVHKECKVPPDSKYIPLLIFAVLYLTFGLEMHVSKGYINQPQIIVSDTTVPRL